MKYKVEISFKPGVLDAEGKAAAMGLKALGFSVDGVSFSKTYLIDTKSSAKHVEEMCKKLLANPIIQDYSIQELNSGKKK